MTERQHWDEPRIAGRGRIQLVAVTESVRFASQNGYFSGQAGKNTNNVMLSTLCFLTESVRFASQNGYFSGQAGKNTNNVMLSTLCVE